MRFSRRNENAFETRKAHVSPQYPIDVHSKRKTGFDSQNLTFFLTFITRNVFR
nr:MAG TPA: hypothetical protein [Caudoviricetes sp.]